MTVMAFNPTAPQFVPGALAHALQYDHVYCHSSGSLMDWESASTCDGGSDCDHLSLETEIDNELQSQLTSAVQLEIEARQVAAIDRINSTTTEACCPVSFAWQKVCDFLSTSRILCLKGL